MSGTVLFYNSLPHPSLNNRVVIFLHDSHFSKRSLPPSTYPLQRLLHKNVGGATSFVGLAGYLNANTVPVTSSLRRYIKHFIDYSLPPSRVTKRVASSRIVSATSSLTIPSIHAMVSYPSSFSASGVATRPLSSQELALLFGLDSLLAKYTTLDSFPIPPVQLMDALLKPVLCISTTPQPSSVMRTVPIQPIPRHTFLPSLNKFLSLNWAQVDYTAEKSAKSDDAAPVLKHWHARITDVFPNAASLIRPLQQLILRRLYRRLFLEFLQFLDNKYGSSWPVLIGLHTTRIKAYVDDLRVIAANLHLAWLAARQAASRIQFLGSQDAPRKRRLYKGPWAGTVFNTGDGKVTKSVTHTKWLKAKSHVMSLREKINEYPDGELEFKWLERIRGFLCHLGMAFPIIFPYLKGFHLTLCQHLPKRSESGWKMTELQWIGFAEEQKAKGKVSEQEKEEMMNQITGLEIKPPKTVKPLPRFITCLKALETFFSEDEPPIVQVRSTSVFVAIYGFLDASGTGFGSTLASEKKSNIEWAYEAEMTKATLPIGKSSKIWFAPWKKRPEKEI